MTGLATGTSSASGTIIPATGTSLKSSTRSQLHSTPGSRQPGDVLLLGADGPALRLQQSARQFEQVSRDDARRAIDGEVEAYIGLGGNFLRAVPEQAPVMYQNRASKCASSQRRGRA